MSSHPHILISLNSLPKESSMICTPWVVNNERLLPKNTLLLKVKAQQLYFWARIEKSPNQRTLGSWLTDKDVL